MEWNDIADVWLYWDDVKSRIIRGVGERIGYSSGKNIKIIMCIFFLTDNFILYCTNSVLYWKKIFVFR